MKNKLIKLLKKPNLWVGVCTAAVLVVSGLLAYHFRPADEGKLPVIYYGQEEQVVTADPSITIPSSYVPTLPVDETDPMGTEPGVTEPGMTDPDVSQPNGTDPNGGEPDATGPNTSQQPSTSVPKDPQQQEQSDPPQVTIPQKQELKVERVAAFAGAYVEDGSDEPVQNVAAILVTNETEEFLSLATLTYDIDGKEAKFIVTGLPAGSSTWVMEAGRTTVNEDSKFTLKDTDTAFQQDAVTSIEGTTLQVSGDMMKMENNSEKTLRNVAIYYKALHTDGNYFGGITYMTVIGDLEPGTAQEKLAGHYKEGWTEIVRVSYQIDE